MKKKIVLINPPYESIVLRDMYSSTISKGSYNWPNSDLLAMSGTLKNHCDVFLIDANTLGLNNKESIDRIIDCSPDGIVVAFGASVKNSDYNFIKKIKEQLPNVKIVASGGLLYHNSYKEISEHLQLDGIVLNYVTDDILKYFNENYEGLKNFVYRLNGEIVEKEKIMPENDFSYSIPPHEHLPLEKYRLSHGKKVPLTSVVTSYGCPAKCSFCVSGKINYRARSVDNIIEELKYVKKLGVREVFFRDNWFGANPRQFKELLNKMIEENLQLSWVSDTRANVITKDSAELMKASGCHALHMGVESANDDILKRYDKKLTILKIKEAFRICHEVGISTVGYFIIGLPGETKNDVTRTVDLAIELNCDYASFNMPIPIFGTELRDNAIDNGWLEVDNMDSGYDGSALPIIGTKDLSAKDIRKLKNLAYLRFYLRTGFVVKTLHRIRTWYQLKMLFLEFYNLVVKIRMS